MSQTRESQSSEYGSTDSNPEQSENTEASCSRDPDPVGDREKASGSKMLSERPIKRSGKRPGRKPSKTDVKAKLERSRQSARECRARKRLRYQYLEELVRNREEAIFALRNELETWKKCCNEADQGIITEKLRSLISTDSSSWMRGMTGQRSRASSLGTGRTSTVTSGTQSHQLISTHKARSFDEGEVSRSSSHFQGSFTQQMMGGSDTNYPSGSMSSQLHGAGSHVRESGLQYSGVVTDIGQILGSGSQMSSSDSGHYTGAQYGGNMLYASQPSVDVGGSSYDLPMTQGYVYPPNVTIPRTVTSSDDPMTTLATLSSQAPYPPSYEASTSYSGATAIVQPSTSRAAAHGVSDISWLSLLGMMDMDTGLSREGAESASGTPQSVDGIRALPTVVTEYLDSDSGSSS